MQYAIFLNTVLPVRNEADERSEMVTQLLFGEYCNIISEKDSFVKIQNHADEYTGWVDKKMLTEISEQDFEQLKNSPIFRVNVPIADVFCLTDKSIYRLSAGSLLPFYNYETNNFRIADKIYQIHPSFITYLPNSSKENVIATAMIFQNTPYLWGGKSLFGIDCSGFVQTVYSLNGFSLPRDASQQINKGVCIESIENAQPTDLLFFEKNGKITHVGIYMGNNKIIHASGKVRIDKIDNKGIYNEEFAHYTHNLAGIRRI